MGTTDTDGRFTLAYTAKAAGAKVGMHSVSISLVVPNADPDKDDAEVVPARYNSATELSQEVKSGSNSFEFDLKTE